MSVGKSGPSEEALLAGVRAGDVAAFETVYRRHVGAVRGGLAAGAGGADLPPWLDLEVFRMLLERIDELPSGVAFGSTLESLASELASAGTSALAKRPAGPRPKRRVDPAADVERRLRAALELRLAVLRRGPVCERFAAHRDAGELVEAARHAASCATCGADRSTSAGAPARVLFVSGAGAGRAVEVHDRLCVGRECGGVDEAQRLVVEDPEVSRSHFEIVVEPDGGQATVKDTSRNGTLLDGAPLEPGRRAVLKHGALLRAGAVELRFEAGGDGGEHGLGETLDVAEAVGLVSAARGAAAGDATLDALGQRERQVLTLVARGASDEAIADQLTASVSAVEADTRNAFAKLGVAGTADERRRVRAVIADLGGADGEPAPAQ